jgi:hypothetical protein
LRPFGYFLPAGFALDFAPVTANVFVGCHTSSLFSFF